MSNYSRGAQFENRVKHDMIARGYHAHRVAGSHSPVDVVCIGHRTVVYVQCKISGVLVPDEWNIFFDYCSEVGAIPVLAEKDKGIRYYVLTGKKDGTHKPQPKKEWKP